jgi:2-C-methyl-D-erythritol 4-phosphate cytidylyltransferase
VELAGRPMLLWSQLALRSAPSVEYLVTAVPPSSELIETGPPGGEEVETDPDLPELPPWWGIPSYVRGGSSRSESVRRALEVATVGEIVLVHDAARPLVTPGLAESVIAALVADPDADAAIAAAPVTDTIKRAARDGGEVRETLDRGELWAVQTPQVFRRAALGRALDVDAATLAAATDDAWLVEQAGGKVIVVPAPAENMKVTTPFDLRIAELLLGERGRFGHTDPA